MKGSDGTNTRDRNRVDVIMGPHLEDEVIGKVESEINTKNFYRLDLLILKDKHTKNFFSYNFVDVLTNIFGNLSPISINFRFFFKFSIDSFYFAASDGTSDWKLLDFTSLGGPANSNPGNILTFYH